MSTLTRGTLVIDPSSGARGVEQCIPVFPPAVLAMSATSTLLATGTRPWSPAVAHAGALRGVPPNLIFEVDRFGTTVPTGHGPALSGDGASSLEAIGDEGAP